jgi:hypothetical protein
VYVLEPHDEGSYSVRTTSPDEAAAQDAHASAGETEEEDGAGEISQQITTALQAGEDGS